MMSMLGFADLAGSDPCPECGSDSGDCGWLYDTGRCSDACVCCQGTNVGRLQLRQERKLGDGRASRTVPGLDLELGPGREVGLVE